VAAGHHAAGVAVDVRDPKQAGALADAAVERFGRLDVWVNNAGVNVIKPGLELGPDEWRRVIDTNLNGCFFGSQATARHMVPRGGGAIIQIGSIFGELGSPAARPTRRLSTALSGSPRCSRPNGRETACA
jgi:3-oxoacyl-[acyl-carrier protein] reductase